MKKEDIYKYENFTELDRHFARFIERLSRDENPWLVMASMLVSNRTSRGDICIDLNELGGKDISEIFFEEDGMSFKLPDTAKWINELKGSSIVGKPGEFKPLILNKEGKLYLYRYWEYENNLALNIKGRLNSENENIDFDLLSQSMDKLFPSGSGQVDWQRIAAFSSALKRFSIISGGPGTGKTSTVIRIIVLLIENAIASGFTPKIALAAPTGKAAARLKESIKSTLESLECSDSVKDAIPGEAFTIHRLLGTIYGSPYFKHNRNNQVPHDIVVIDESSMADLALMSKLLEAVRIDASVILLGDKDQLSSVEAGAVLGDICDTGKEHGYSKSFVNRVRDYLNEDISQMLKQGEPTVSDSIIVLNKNYRFGSNSGIGEVSRAVKDGHGDRVIELLNNGNFDDIKLVDNKSYAGIKAYIDEVSERFVHFFNSGTPGDILEHLNDFIVLTALRKGPLGVENVNRIIERNLRDKGFIKTGKKWYNGQPIMIAENDYNLRLYNGDIGLILNDNSSPGRPRFCIQSADATLRKILPLKLPHSETAFALTVHKSQGSEFGNVLLILPDKPSPVLTRELIYTAITRPKKRVDIWGSEEIIRYMIKNPVRRKSGLRDALWST
ncbi:exodeoxyribonuclease V subunit alpha [Spirochaetota bacterium]